ncbi:unnamed protein product [Linum tenue]|uniref:Uncharacterized protein n=1 Tax=Linum tenue TaxID=586396 RepID=A0AAV0Q956_9ROSI|nr:unnamed protein product [Linum tenue]CAI0541793.1 unnamed protein product [Linum tenue]
MRSPPSLSTTVRSEISGGRGRASANNVLAGACSAVDFEDHNISPLEQAKEFAPLNPTAKQGWPSNDHHAGKY